MIKRILGGQHSEGRSLTFSEIWGRGIDGTGASSASGEVVDYDSALTLSSVYAAIRLLSDTVSTLPLDVFYKDKQGEHKFRPAPSWLFNMNPVLADHEVLGQIVVSLLLDGNAYVATLRDETGAVLQITPLDPSTITPTLDKSGGGSQRIVFTSTNSPGIIFTSRDITHVRNMMKPGTIEGLSPIKAAREYLGLGLATQRYGSSFFKNSGVPGGIVEVPGQLSSEGIAQMKSAWDDVHRGAGNARKLAVLTESAKFSTISLSPEDSQFLETKAATVGDVSRLFGVPPHLLADQVKSTSWGSGLHEQNVAMVQYSLRPQVARLESGLTRIMRSEGVAVAFAKFDVESLTRGTNEKWSQVYSPAIQSGILSVDEVRALEGLPPLPDGEGTVHYAPLHLAPLHDLDKDGKGV